MGDHVGTPGGLTATPRAEHPVLMNDAPPKNIFENQRITKRRFGDLETSFWHRLPDGLGTLHTLPVMSSEALHPVGHPRPRMTETESAPMPPKYARHGAFIPVVAQLAMK